MGYRRRFSTRSRGPSRPARTYGPKATAASLHKEFNKPKKGGPAQKPPTPMVFVAIPLTQYTHDALNEACRSRIQAGKTWKSWGHVPPPPRDGILVVRIRKLADGFEVLPMFASRDNEWRRINPERVIIGDGHDRSPEPRPSRRP